jgi:hypothetical protein
MKRHCSGHTSLTWSKLGCIIEHNRQMISPFFCSFPKSNFFKNAWLHLLPSSALVQSLNNPFDSIATILSDRYYSTTLPQSPFHWYDAVDDKVVVGGNNLEATTALDAAGCHGVAASVEFVATVFYTKLILYWILWVWRLKKCLGEVTVNCAVNDALYSAIAENHESGPGIWSHESKSVSMPLPHWVIAQLGRRNAEYACIGGITEVLRCREKKFHPTLGRSNNGNWSTLFVILLPLPSHT